MPRLESYGFLPNVKSVVCACVFLRRWKETFIYYRCVT